MTRRRRPWLLVPLLVVAVVAAACGDDGGSPDDAAVVHEPRLVGPAGFAEAIAAPDVVVINVHVPDEGSIEGTDLTIPFDEIAESDELPADLDTPLAVYCRSDNMSASAVEDLAALGYRDVVELDGGFDAWVADGRELLPPDR